MEASYIAPAKPPMAAWKKKLILAVAVLGGFLVVCWSIVIWDALYTGAEGNKLIYHGIIPRTTRGLVGVISAPFIHDGYSHIEANTMGIILLGGLLFFSPVKTFFIVTAFVWVLSGFFTWCIARPNVSFIGAGGLCFGWFAYLLITPFFARPISVKFILIALVTGVLYGGLVFGLFSTDPNVGWEANLSGFFSGTICSLGYWFLYLRVLYPKYFAGRIGYAREDLESIDSPKPVDPAASAAILTAPHRLSSPMQKRPLLQEPEAFGSQPYTQTSQPTNNNPNEPSWLKSPQSNYPSANLPRPDPSAPPSWLNPTTATPQRTNDPFASDPFNAFPNEPKTTSFNPFGQL